MTARALWYVGGDACELRDCSVPVVGPGEVLVVATHGAVSRGTESLVLRGGVPPSEHTRMRCPFMQGDFGYPCKYGYCSVGFVAEAGKGAEPLLGRHVFCLFPHQDRYVVRMEAVHALPEGTPPSRAVLTPNLETAVNIVWDSKLSVGDRLAVVGAGVVGCLVAYVASRVADVSVLLVDVDASRSTLAERLGVRFRLAEQLTAEDADRDVVVHCSGSPAGCATALSLAGDEAAVVEASWFGDKQVSLPLGEAFHSRRLKLVSSQVGQLPVERRPRWSYARRIQAVPLPRLLAGTRHATCPRHVHNPLPHLSQRWPSGWRPTRCSTCSSRPRTSRSRTSQRRSPRFARPAPPSADAYSTPYPSYPPRRRARTTSASPGSPG